MGTPVEHLDLIPEAIRAFTTSILTDLRALKEMLRDGEAEVRAASHGWLLVPLYQPAGSDGFFLARTEQIQSSVESSLGLSAR